MKLFQVKMHGNVIKTFTTQDAARDFLLEYLEHQMLINKQLDYIDESVEKSDLSEAKAVIKHIMEIK